MATGNPPPDVFVEVPQGLWVPARWFGCEPKPALVLVFIELFGFLMHTSTAIIAATIINVVWFFVLRLQFERDPVGFEIRRRNLWYLGVRRMRGVALISSGKLPFNEALR